MTMMTPVVADVPFWFGNTRVAIRVPASGGVDRLSVIEHWMPFGESPPLHIHHTEDELFRIIEGRMRFRIGGKDIIAGPGATLLAPMGVPHHFLVESPEGARVLTVTHGGAFETMVRAMGRPAEGPGLPPAAEPTPGSIAMLTMLCAENGIEIVGTSLK